MTNHREVEITVLEWWSDEENPLSEFLSTLNAAWDGLSDPEKDSAKVVLGNGGSDGVAIIRVYYTRPENAQDVAEQEAEERAYLAERRARETYGV